jgi:hypothetical protein
VCVQLVRSPMPSGVKSAITYQCRTQSIPLYPYLVKLGDLEKFRFLLDR